MNKSRNIFILSSFIFLGWFTNFQCKSKARKFQSEFLEEKSFPKDILDIYLRKISLDPLNNGVDSFEIRKWRPFINDSFPISLERYFFEKGKLSAEIYIFYFKNENDEIIRKKEQLKNINFDKFSIESLQERFIDSLQIKYNLFEIDTFDTKIFQNLNTTGYIMSKPELILMEQATAFRYKRTFITNPKNYSWVNKSISKYSDFCRFTTDSVLYYNPNVIKWLDEKIDNIKKY